MGLILDMWRSLHVENNLAGFEELFIHKLPQIVKSIARNIQLLDNFIGVLTVVLGYRMPPNDI